MAEVLNAITGVLLLGLLAGSIFLWVAAYGKLIAGKPLLTMEPRRTVPWGLADLFIIFITIVVVIIGGQLLGAWLFNIPRSADTSELTAQHLSVMLFSSSLSMLAACAISVLLLLVRGASWKDLGLQAGQFLRDVKLGATAFVMLAPPMYLLQFLLTRIWPSEHPIQTLLLEDPDPAVIVGAAMTAVIVAPLTEEIFFRLILQGWLEKCWVWLERTRNGQYEMSQAGAVQSQLDSIGVFLGNYTPEPPVAEEQSELAEAEFTEQTTLAPASDETANANPYLSPRVDWAEDQPKPIYNLEVRPALGIWPIFISSAIFALLHWGHGPDPVPLFFLAVGLGYLYHRTHRIVPCITVHFMVNGLSMIALIMFLLSGEPPP